MKFEFVKIVNNNLLHKANIVKINEAFELGKITKIQTKLLLLNNSKWKETCNHHGLLGNQDNKIIFVPRTSYNYKLSKPRTFEQLKVNSEIFNEKKIEFYRFNELCNIGSLKWVLGNTIDNIKIQSLEDRPDIVAKLVGSYQDLEYFKEWVSNTDLDEFNISPYFNMEQTIDELFSSNIKNNIKDE